MMQTRYYLFGSGEEWDDTPKGVEGLIGVFPTLESAVEAVDTSQSPARLRVKPQNPEHDGQVGERIYWAQVATIDAGGMLRVVAWFRWIRGAIMDEPKWEYEVTNGAAHDVAL